MTAQVMEQHTETPAGTRQIMRRRGLIAGAAALAVGFMAKQVAEPAAAETVAIAYAAGATEVTNLGGAKTALSLRIYTSPVGMEVNVSPSPDNYDAVGFLGVGSQFGPGVMGLMDSVPFPGPNQNAAVYGGASSGGTGIHGVANGGNGVYGLANAAGTAQVAAGVFGDSTTTYGVIGRTTAPGYSGLTAITGTAGVAALAATSTNANAYAAYFTGTTVVQGDFVAFGGAKSAAVPHADGSHRLVYCVASPESWFEDFGESTLVAGVAQVAIDKTFAEITHTDSYQVFLTEYGGHNDLFVAKRTASGFEVRAKDGIASAVFGWRAVAKRADIKGERLAKFDLPKINHPDPDKLPNPEPPAPPTKR
jgi:hypothetical protein